MSMNETPLATLLKDVMRRSQRLPSQLASDLRISHATVSRWISGECVPSTISCRKLSEYSGIPLQKVLSAAGHVPKVAQKVPAEWPEFREYARNKYPDELDDDLINMIEYLIQWRR